MPVPVSIMKDAKWIFQSFGIRAGLRYVWDTLCLRVKRLVKREEVTRFEDLTDEQAEKVAWAFGLHKWDDRDHLNRIWHNFEKTLN